MTTTTAQNQNRAAFDLGRQFAEEINAAPHEAANWRPLGDNDDMPPEDYRSLVRVYGDVTRDMERAYRDGFNTTFDTSLSQKCG